MRRVLAAVLVVFALSARPSIGARSGSTDVVIIPRVAIVQPLLVTYQVLATGYTETALLAARDQDEAMLMLMGLLGEQQKIQVLSIEEHGDPVGVRRDGYLPTPPGPFTR